MKTKNATLSILSVLAIFASLSANAQLQARSAVDVLTNDELAQPIADLKSANPSAKAPAPVPTYANAITVQNNTDHAVWITIYNMFGSIRDAACVTSGDLGKFHNYFGPGFKVRGEVTQNADCSGRVIFDTNIGVSMPITGSGVGVSLEKSSTGFYFN